MLEISPEIPFLADSKLRFLEWSRSTLSLDSWNWSEGLYCFLQFRNLSHFKEMRFGGPDWGLPNSVEHIEYSFYRLNDISAIRNLSETWVKTLSRKTVIVLIASEEEESARFEFAKVSLANRSQSWEGVAKSFGIIGENYLFLRDFDKELNKQSTTRSSFYLNPAPIIFVNTNHMVSKPLTALPVISNGTLDLLEIKRPVASLVIESQGKVVAPPIASEPEEINLIEEPVPADEMSPIQITPVSLEITEKPGEAIDLLAGSDPPVPFVGTENTKFLIQLKLMGVMSLLFVLTVSTIIFFASTFFRNTSELQLRDNNLRMAEIVGLKIRTDVLSTVEKGRQIAIILTSPGIPEDQKNLLVKTFFKTDKEFVYLGIFEKRGDQLVNKREVFSEEELKQTSVTEEDFNNIITRNKDAFGEAFTGQPVIVNSSPGFQEPSFAIAIPASDNGQMDNILIMIVKLTKIIGAFEKKGIESTFMVNGAGVVIAHPKEDLILAATDLSAMPIVRYMLTSAANTGQNSYLDPEFKTQYLGSFKKIGFADAGVLTIVSEDKAFEAVYNIQKRNLYIMGIGLCFALISIFFFAKTITKPILHLLTATLEISKGNFKIGIKPTTRDEVGLLTEYFIEMGKGLEEREKVKNILGSMIDPVVVKEAMIDLAALKRGSETNITAFFSDVAGFSTISEQLKSFELASLLNEYLSAMTLILKKHEGVLDKYIGDAIVGIFSAPVIVAEHQLKAARASVEMMIKMEELRAYWKSNNLYSKEAQNMDCRIGLNSGLAKVGFMGTDALASYTMMGDTVNLAGRLEAAAKDYGVNILITDSIKSHCEEEMLTRFLDLVRVKGKNEPVRIHELIGFKTLLTDNLFESAALYEEGFNSYLEKSWTKAILLFERSEKAYGKKDKASRVLIERCEEYKISSPGEDWDGVFTRAHK